jgi:hypothetical protein
MSSDHHHACDCAAHRHGASAASTRASAWTGLLPLLACAVCPACLATYAKLLSVLGVSVGLTEYQHTIILAFAIALSVLVSAWRSARSRRAWPLAFALLGSCFVVTGHLSGELHALEWLGVLVLLVSGAIEQFRMPRAHVAA